MPDIRLTPSLQVLLINVGSNSNERNGIAPIYPDGRFEYWPIEESCPGPNTPRFRNLLINCPNPDLSAHYDPRFEPTPTYGDKYDAKAFTEMANAIKLGKSAMLLFAATLRYAGETSLCPHWIDPGIGYYIIGFFHVESIQVPVKGETLTWQGQEHNAHYLRPNHDAGKVKVLVKGKPGSRLLKKAYPISARVTNKLHPTLWLKNKFLELGGGPIGGGPWFRRSFRNVSKIHPAEILRTLSDHEH